MWGLQEISDEDVHVLMRDEKEGRKKQGHTNKAKMSCLGWDSNSQHSTLSQSALSAELHVHTRAAHVHCTYQGSSCTLYIPEQLMYMYMYVKGGVLRS